MKNPSFVAGFHATDESPQEYRHLTGDIHTSRLALGAGPLGITGYGVEMSDPVEFVVASIRDFHVNYIDTAPWYGQGRSEETLGRCLKDVPRKAYFLATKVGRYDLDLKTRFNFSGKKTLESVEKSLELLKIGYIDVIQIHDCEFSLDDYKMILEECLPALQELKEQGKVRYIGITGYPLEMFEQLIPRSPIKIDTILSYCKLSIHDDSLAKFVEKHQSSFLKDVGIVSASALSMGLLTQNGPQDWHPAALELKVVAKKAAEIAAAKGCNMARLAIRFSVERQTVNSTCLIGARTLDEIKMNFDNTPLSELENTVLDEIIELFQKSSAKPSWEGTEVAQYKKFMETGKTDENDTSAKFT